MSTSAKNTRLAVLLPGKDENVLVYAFFDVVEKHGEIVLDRGSVRVTDERGILMDVSRSSWDIIINALNTHIDTNIGNYSSLG